jgi:hypothetical protein
MKLYNKIFTIACIVAFSTGCKKVDFGSENITPDPNANSTPNTAELLTFAITSSWGGLTIANTEPGLFVQYLSQSTYPSAQLYATTSLSWASWYAVPLEDLYTVIQYNTTNAATAAANGSNNNQIATARILKAYLFSVVTDMWGDVPYSQALQANNTPAYDKQQAIYTDLFKELKAAEAQFDGGAAAKGDILFYGDASQWKRFANSLRMIWALRISKADPVTAKSEFLLAYNDAAGYISTNAQNAAFTYTNNSNYRNPWNSLYNQRSDYGVSSTLISWLQNTADPRLSKFAQPTAANTYVGVPYGLNTTHLQSYLNGAPDYSRMSVGITGWQFSGASSNQLNFNGAPGYIVTAAQMKLTLAEAQLNGWIGVTTDAVASYNAAVQLSWDQWGATYTPTQLSTYLASSQIAVTNTTPAATALARIGVQKWLALYPNGQEAWSEWRRLASPVLTPSPDATNTNGQITRRFGYPATEIALNGANYNAQVATMTGGDANSVHVWWDK